MLEFSFFMFQQQEGKIRAKKAGHTISSSAVNCWEREHTRWLYEKNIPHSAALLSLSSDFFFSVFKSRQGRSLGTNELKYTLARVITIHIWTDIGSVFISLGGLWRSRSNSSNEQKHLSGPKDLTQYAAKFTLRHQTHAKPVVGHTELESLHQEIGHIALVNTASHLFGSHWFKHLLQQDPHLLDVVHQHTRLENEKRVKCGSQGSQDKAKNK